MKFLLLLLLTVVLTVAQEPTQAWWETATFYQIYPRSFQDTDGDGIGDLNGVTEKLAYLKEIGVAATWLSPIMTSPMVDFGYDIANFYDIDPIFGTMADFDKLVVAANEMGIKIIIDLVPNHSSDECEWFIKSVARDPEYEDFYVWHPGKIVNGVREPPTNWISVFRGPMWEWNEQRQEYYLHQFHRKQPDLNYRNPKVVEQMKDVIRFWMKKGINGLRIDSVPYLFEIAPDADGNYPDQDPDPTVSDPDDYYSQLHTYTMSQPETIDLLYEFRATMDEAAKEVNTIDPVILAEAYIDLDILMQYYGNGTTEGAQIPFNTELIVNIDNNSNAFDFKRVIDSWLDQMPENRVANWVIGNHDRKRVGTRLGVQRTDMMNMLISVLPGNMVTYYGEEIGMTDVEISWEDTVDPQACQGTKELLSSLSRDPIRTPLQWNQKVYAGFSTSKPWLPVADNYLTKNVMIQRAGHKSHLNIYKNLRNLRKFRTFRYGIVQVNALNENVLVVTR